MNKHDLKKRFGLNVPEKSVLIGLLITLGLLGLMALNEFYKN